MQVGAAPSSQSSSADLTGQSPLIQALAGTAVGAGMTVAEQAVSGALLTATSTVTGTLFTPEWLPNTAYKAGQVVFDSNASAAVTMTVSLIQRKADGVSGATYDATEAAQWQAAPAGSRPDYPMRWNAGLLGRIQCNGGATNYGWVPRAPKRGDGNENMYIVQPAIWSIDFDWYTAAGALEVPVFTSGGVNQQIRFVIDGQYAAAAGLTTTTGGWSNVKLSGVTAGFHRVRIETNGIVGGVRVATADKIFPPSMPAGKRLMIIGDSYDQGAIGTTSTVSIDDVRGFNGQVCRILGMDYVSGAVSGSGISVVNTNQWINRVPDIAAIAPDYLLVRGSVNESPQKATTLPALAATYYAAVKAAAPSKTKILVAGATTFNVSGGTDPTASDAITAVLKTAALGAGLDFLDTTGWSPAITAMTAGSTDNLHPTLIGADYFAKRLARAIAKNWSLSL